jgi:hypothetical protein
MAIATSSLDSEVHCLTSDNLPATLRSLPKTLNLTNDKAITVIINIYIHYLTSANHIIAQLNERVYWDIYDG